MSEASEVKLIEGDLRAALWVYKEDSNGVFISSGFDCLLADTLMCAVASSGSPSIREQYNYLRFISADVWNIETILWRLHQERESWVAGQISDNVWMDLAACDIDLFHIEVRSVFDYIAKYFATMAIHRQQVKEKSFSKLRKWVENAENEAKMGSELFQLVRKCDWFDVVCAIRDASVHGGSDTVVFLINNKIAFMSVQPTLKGEVKRRLPKQIMINANVVDFEMYAGLYFGRLLAYLETVANVAYLKCGITRSKSPPINRHLGLDVSKTWIELALRQF